MRRNPDIGRLFYPAVQLVHRRLEQFGNPRKIAIGIMRSAGADVRTSGEQFRQWLEAPEGARLECKEARHGYNPQDLLRYCVALANEGGGQILLGVSDRRPRKLSGTQAFPEPGHTEAVLHQRLGHRIPIEEFRYEGRRVLIAHVPGRLPGTAWNLDGRYLKRAGDALTPLDASEFRNIFEEIGPDFSARPCAAGLDDLSPEALDDFRLRWARKAGDPRMTQWSDVRMLTDAELVIDGVPTHAALILFGTRSALGRHLAQAEIVFEYRSSEASGPAQDRAEFREGFFLVHDRLWEKINLRNDGQSYQDRLFRYEIPTFDESMVREAVLNAFAHRDYRSGGSVFVRQYAQRLEIVSPGGFPPGIGPENIIDQQNPRNRRLAEALARAGLVERAGQGLNIMVETAVRQSKPLPSFKGSAAHEVRLTLEGGLRDPEFVRFLGRLDSQILLHFSTHDFLALDAIAHEQPLTEAMRERLPGLIETGAVERQGRGRGTQYLLSRSLYASLGRAGAYTRRRGLDRETNKALLMQHLAESGEEGAPIGELQQVLPALSRHQIRGLLKELAAEDRAWNTGVTRAGRWFAIGSAGKSGLAGGDGGPTKRNKTQ